MPLMTPHGVGVDFTWTLTIGVVVYSFLAFAGYLVYGILAKAAAKHSKHTREGARHEQT